MLNKARRFLLILAASLGCVVVPAMAEPPLTTPTLDQVIRSGWLKVSLQSGRVVIDVMQLGTVSSGSSSNGQGMSERLSVSQTADGGVLDYERETPEQRLQVVLKGDGMLHVKLVARDPSEAPSLEFIQPADGPLEFSVTSRGQTEHLQAGNLWALLLQRPEITNRYLAPLLEVLRPGWELGETVRRLEHELLQNAGSEHRSQRQHWAEWVAQLADESFARREEADRNLRGAGYAALAYLQRLDYPRLDAEQQFRVRRIIESYSQQIVDDTPQQVADWLSSDPRVWLSLLGRDDPAIREVAAAQLALLLGSPVNVDPRRDPAGQQAAFEALVQRIDRQFPAP